MHTVVTRQLDYTPHLVLAAEQRLSCVHLDQDAAEAPHVNGQVVGDAEQHLRGAVEAALDVVEHLGRGRGGRGEE